MEKIKSFLAVEINKPVVAFRSMIRWIVKQLALYILRLLLWSLFFMAPSFLIVSFVFHWFTGKVRNEIENANQPVRAVRYAPVSSGEIRSQFSMIRTLSQDLRFWVLEFERFRK